MRLLCGICLVVVLMVFVVGPANAADRITSNIDYIRNEKVAPIDAKSVQGEYYNDLIPDTLDIADRSALAINVLTEITNPKADYEIYWCTNFKRNKPILFHDWNDWCGTKFWEALPLMRMVTGSNLNDFVDPVWLDVILRSIGPDGLYYIPHKGRPWALMNPNWADTVWRPDGSITNVEDPTVTHITHPMPIGRVISVLTIYYEISKDDELRKIIEKMIDASLDLMIDKGDYGYFAGGVFEPGAQVDQNAEVPKALVGIESYGRMIQAPAQYYNLTGYEPARKLSQKLINCVLRFGENFDEEGGFIGKEGMEVKRGGPHFHAHTFVLMSMLDYATAVGDEELMAFIEMSFNKAKTYGNPLVGFFPEWCTPDYPFSETCEVADMVALALKLSSAGVGDHWDDADRWIRNQYSENQLTKVDWLYPIIEKMEERPVQLKEIHWGGTFDKVPEGTCTDENVPMRNLGGFAGWPSANDWFNDGDEASRGIMHCCTGNGTRTLYYIWENMLSYDRGELKVNLLMNRASEWADVYSYIPYDGQVRVKIKEPCTKVLIRMPEWIDSNSKDVKCVIGSEERSIKWDGRYIDVGTGRPGELFQVTFPISEKTVKTTIASKDYNITFRGNTAIAIDPPGKYCPLYQRDYYRNNMAWRPVRRFISDTVVEW